MEELERQAIESALAHYAAAREVPGWAKVLAMAAKEYLNFEAAFERYQQTIAQTVPESR